jgi:hypothetical protein
MKKFIHALILVVFSIGCLSTWAVLSLIASSALPGKALPALTILCINFRPLLIALPVVAAMYCLWVWFRKADRVPPWTGFFAATMGSLVLLAFPAMLAAYLPLLSVANQYLASK